MEDQEFRPRLDRCENNLISQYRELKLQGKNPRLSSSNDVGDGSRKVLVIGDLHSPFIKYGYLEFCQKIASKYNINQVVFIGDIIDNHYSSYHETDADGDSAGLELLKAKKEISYWYKAFPEAHVCIGNHDLIPNRKAMTAGLSASWIKTIDEILETPRWTFVEDIIIDGVMYTHGTGRKANRRAQKDLISIVQGHYHSESYIVNFVGEHFKIFAMQLGCGIDRRSYGMAYGKHFDKPHLNCGVVLEDGRLPIIEMMDI